MSHNDQSDGVEAQPKSTLCSNGCGFFANAGTSGMCSKCYRQTEQAQQTLDAVTHKAVAAVAMKAAAAATQAAAITKSETETEDKSQDIASADSTAVLGAPATISSTATSTEAPPPPPSSGPCRCKQGGCKKKLGLTGFTCRCGLTFCGQHRLAESHACTFDYKTFERLKIADNNPLVQASKVQRF